jgi:hypothetical protein
MELSDLLTTIPQYQIYLSGGIGFALGVASRLAKKNDESMYIPGLAGSIGAGISIGVSREITVPNCEINTGAAIIANQAGYFLTDCYFKYYESLKTIVKESVTNIFAK